MKDYISQLGSTPASAEQEFVVTSEASAADSDAEVAVLTGFPEHLEGQIVVCDSFQQQRFSHLSAA